MSVAVEIEVPECEGGDDGCEASSVRIVGAPNVEAAQAINRSVGRTGVRDGDLEVMLEMPLER